MPRTPDAPSPSPRRPAPAASRSPWLRLPWRSVAAAAVILAACLAFRGVIGQTATAAPGETHAQSQSHKAPPESGRRIGPEHDVMAIVNGKDISRPTLAQACVERYGETVLESLSNKRLIEHHCRNRGVVVTEAELDAECERMAKRFRLGKEQWFDLLKRERGVGAEEYKRDILWPTLALRKLASAELTASDDEVRVAYESRYGAAVQARLIVVSDRAKAEQLQREAAARPDEFPRLAMQHSEDVNSASIGGLVQPIRPHLGDPAVERAAFALRPGEVSQVVPAGPQFVLLKCESRVPPRNVPMADVRDELVEQVVEEKLRGVANEVFGKLQASATVQNVYNDPKLRAQMPGVVATVNGDQVTMRELGEECLARYGEEVLEIEIAQLLLKQELDKKKITVTQEDLEQEMGHAAILAGVVNERGEPDMPRWVKAATEEQDLSYDLYVRDSVWPSAALKKLTEGRVLVTDDDLAKGFEANYGKRVRCRAIVLGDLRRAQEVWDKARQNPSPEFFGDLASEYSIEPSSRSLRGEAPPIRQHGGQPQLEKAAFALQPGELSGVVQVNDKFVILKCEGYTDPVKVEPAEVRDLLQQDLFEKKLRIAMAEEFDRLRGAARIDNYLAGTTQAPPAAGEASQARQGTAMRDGAVRPTGATR